MPLDVVRTRHHLKDFNFKNLFIEELGWNHCSNQIDVTLDSNTFSLSAVAEKHGMVAFTCSPSTGERIPDYSLRRKIERQTAKSVHEHIIIYTDFDRTTQVWQWVKRETGKPTACREHAYHVNQLGDSLIQKLQSIVFSLEEEETLTIVEVAGRAKVAFDVERITKRFYDRFKTEHDVFLKFIDGIPDDELQRWYASVMLNRLMFIYFIQKKGFLNNNDNYLINRLHQSKKKGKDRFYKNFLCPLFFEGFAKKAISRSPEINKLLGEIPYLNGGLFLKHQIEELHGRHIEIADNAFEKLFDFFDQYQWHLDERPLRKDNEINPDVLGYIFEKYINQKQMGAYYTKEDITGYISKNTVIPFLFDAAKEKCKIAFIAVNGRSPDTTVWKLLQTDPDRYFYPAVKKGTELSLPEEIAVGIKDVSKRTEWNKPAPSEYALPTEIWREVVARWQRYGEVKAKILNGEIQSINDLITYNLDIRQFAQDVIWNSEGPELLRAFYHAIEKVTVLDPTCGSGAFLFAALNILEPLYEACLGRMQVFVNELDVVGADPCVCPDTDLTKGEHTGSPLQKKYRSDKYGDFKKILKRVEEHPNLKYFIFKSIIVNNLYGVDIMEEAIEICKLRLFLKLVAQIDKVEAIEPLPDIDFNIRAGNTLVGFATYDEVKRAVTSKLDFENTMERIEEQAQEIDSLFKLFQKQQTELGGEVTPEDKQVLRAQLKSLEDELNQYLASEYGVNPSHPSNSPLGKGGLKGGVAYQQWLASHKPFHWFIEFYGILKNGGFDVIIGNPPYVEYSKVKGEYTIKGYLTESCGNLYAYVLERNRMLLSSKGYTGMIVPHSAFCTDRMEPLINLFDKNSYWISTYSIRPAKLFVGVDQRLAIYLTAKSVISAKAEIQKEKDWIPYQARNDRYCTRYHNWPEEFRPYLFSTLSYAPINSITFKNSIPKVSSLREELVWQKLNKHKAMSHYLSGSSIIYFHNAPRYWIRAMDFAPYFWNERDGEQISTQVKPMYLQTKSDSLVVTAILNSSLFYWWFIVLSDCRHLNMREIENFPVGLDKMAKTIKEGLSKLSDALMDDYKKHAYRKECNYKTTGKVVYDEFYPKHSKPIIDEIDQVLAKHYGFTDEELDFIINYDIKYRMGRDEEHD